MQDSESISEASQVKSNYSSTRNISLLKIRKNSNSMGDHAIMKNIVIYYYDASTQQTHQFNDSFSENLTIGDMIQFMIPQINLQLNLKCQADWIQVFLPKKKFGKPNEDFPYFRHEVTLKECGQLKFALKITIPILESPETNSRKTTIQSRQLNSSNKCRNSYSNSLNSTPNKKSISEKKTKGQKSFFCFCVQE